MNWKRTIGALGALALSFGAVCAAAQPRPAAPVIMSPVNYRDPEAWLCLPGRFDACTVDLSATIVTSNGRQRLVEFRLPSREPQVDCFYVYPTVSRDAGPYSDMTAGPEERLMIAQQFARFSAVCRPFAPIYRQLTRSAVLAQAQEGGQPAPPAQGGGGYEDVRAAFRSYMEDNNQGRGFILVGSSQGAQMLSRLVSEEIEGTELAPYMVSAILLGANVRVPAGGVVGGTFKSTPLCVRDNQTGCVIAYSSFRDTLPPSDNARFGKPAGGLVAACTNPANLRTGKGQPESYFSTLALPDALTGPQPNWTGNAWAPVGTPFVQTPDLVTTECVSNLSGNYLSVHVNANPRDPRTDDIAGDFMTNGQPDPAWGLHPIDLNLSLGDLVEIAGRQARTWRPLR